MESVTRGTGRLALILGLCLSILFTISGLGCRKDTSQVGDAPPSDAEMPTDVSSQDANVPAQTEPDTVVATVNGNPIGQKELDARVAVAMRQFGAKLANLPPQFAEQVQRQVSQQVLGNLVSERLLDEQVKAAHIQVTDEEILAEIAKAGAQQNPPVTVEDFKARVAAQGGNFDAVKDEFRKGMGYRKIMEAQWTGKIDVNEVDARQYYDSHTKDFERAEQVRASHILISSKPTDPNSDPNEVKTAARAKAEGLLKQVKEGADFAALAKENSDCPSAANGGDLDFFGRGGMVKPFEDAAFALASGQVSDVVETEFGYHIIKVTDRKEASVDSFDDTKAGIVTLLTNERRNAVTTEYIQSLKDKANIVYSSAEAPQPDQPAPAPQPVAPTTSEPNAAAAPEPNAANG